MSMAGRLCLVQSVISGSAMHSMKIYKWPKALIKELELATHNFLWTGKTCTQSSAMLNWSRVCAIKEKGRIYVISFVDLNLSLMRKLEWKLITDFSKEKSMILARYVSDVHRRLSKGPILLFGVGSNKKFLSFLITLFMFWAKELRCIFGWRIGLVPVL